MCPLGCHSSIDILHLVYICLFGDQLNGTGWWECIKKDKLNRGPQFQFKSPAYVEILALNSVAPLDRSFWHTPILSRAPNKLTLERGTENQDLQNRSSLFVISFHPWFIYYATNYLIGILLQGLSTPSNMRHPPKYDSFLQTQNSLH